MKGAIRAIGVIAGLLIGAGLLFGGALVFLSGVGKPGISPVATSQGVAGGNLPLWMGVILMIAGVATLIGIVRVEIGNWEGGSDDSQDD